MERFEEIRARWETAKPADETSTKMVNHSDSQMAQRPLNADSNTGGSSKFRRKLSHGLSFISNPLAQRKISPGRQLLASTTTTTSNIPLAGPIESERRLSMARSSHSFDQLRVLPVQSTTFQGSIRKNRNRDAEGRPKALPRSRTMSLIPRPSRSVSLSSVTESHSSPQPHSPPLPQPDPKARSAVTKIPSPPATSTRHLSSRQYTREHTAQQAKYIAAGMAFAGTGSKSPSKSSTRSQTTPNLVKSFDSSQPHFMMPRKPGMPAKARLSSIQQPVLKENAPTSKRSSHRLSQIQEQSPRRESLTPKDKILSRRSVGPVISLSQNKQPVNTTPTTVTKRLSTNLATQTPLIAKRAQPNKPNAAQNASTFSNSNRGAIALPRLMGPVNPPTQYATDPTPKQPSLPRASTERDIRRRTFQSPAGRNGRGLLSQSKASTNNEVRLPRSSTFHTLRRCRDTPPPVPPIPEEYKSPERSSPSRNLDWRTETENFPILTLPKTQSEPFLPFPYSKQANGGEQFSSIPINQSDNDTTESSQEPSDEEEAWPLVPPKGNTFQETLPSSRPWSIYMQYSANADSEITPQVKDYMPPVWWAGRFQSRLDQWRTEAMKAELDPSYQPEGTLAQCKLNQHKVVACYIFLQLRDLCATNQAADSLWDFEYKYRQDHKLLDTITDITPLPRRSNENVATPKGPLGRAVRKLTPRKSSLVNLFKSKGSGKPDEAKSGTEAIENLKSYESGFGSSSGGL